MVNEPSVFEPWKFYRMLSEKIDRIRPHDIDALAEEKQELEPLVEDVV